MVERALQCPYCGQINDLHDEPAGTAPEEGDGSICWTCKQISKFTADGGLRVLEGEELEEVRRDPKVRATLAAMRESFEPGQVMNLLRDWQTPHGQQCREAIKMMFQEMVDEMAAITGHEPQGGFTVTTFRVVAPLFDEAVFDCLHGITYWIAPDAELQKWFLQMTDHQVRRWIERQ